MHKNITNLSQSPVIPNLIKFKSQSPVIPNLIITQSTSDYQLQIYCVPKKNISTVEFHLFQVSDSFFYFRPFNFEIVLVNCESICASDPHQDISAKTKLIVKCKLLRKQLSKYENNSWFSKIRWYARKFLMLVSKIRKYWYFPFSILY